MNSLVVPIILFQAIEVSIQSSFEVGQWMGGWSHGLDHSNTFSKRKGISDLNGSSLNYFR